MPKRRPPSHPEDDEARLRDLEALLAPRRVVLQDLPIACIAPNPFQARRRFEGIEELADAIRAHGFITRLRVRPAPDAPDHFQLVYGERRLRAALAAGLTVVPCEIAELSDEDMREVGLLENIQRQDLDPLDEARAYQLLVDDHGYNTRKLAARLGKSVGYVHNRLALLRLPAEVKQLILDRPDYAVRTAQRLATLPADERQEVLAQLTPETPRREVSKAIAGRIAAVREDLAEMLAADRRAVAPVLSRWKEVSGTPEGRAALLEHVEWMLYEIEQLTELMQQGPTGVAP